jgi:hypothetical protein
MEIAFINISRHSRCDGESMGLIMNNREITIREITIRDIQAFILCNPDVTKDDILDHLRKLYSKKELLTEEITQ